MRTAPGTMNERTWWMALEGVYVDPATGIMPGGCDPRRNASAAAVH